MNEQKVKKAEDELAWRDSREFARSFEKTILGMIKKKEHSKNDFFSLLNKTEIEWLLRAYESAKKDEKRIFFKTLIHIIYLLGTKRIGQDNLAKMLGKMAENNAHLGELYDYLVQYSDDRIKYKKMRFGSLVADIRKESDIEREYYTWFSKEYHIPQEGLRLEYPTFFTNKSPEETIRMRKNVNWAPLSSILSTTYGLYVGTAILGKIKKYIQQGGITKLRFENKERAARIGELLFEFGIIDISQSSNKITLGLKETIYNARKRGVSSIEPGRKGYLLDRYLEYFKKHGLRRAQYNRITGLFTVGEENRALDTLCKSMLQVCKKQYLIIGETKERDKTEGKRILSAFKRYLGIKGNASLISIYEMVEQKEYFSALHHLKNISIALEKVDGEYPNTF